LVPPDDFIPDLEFTRMTNHLTYYALDVNLARMQELFKAGFNLNVAINISITNLLQPDFADNIISILENYHFPAHHLALEITERGFISDDVESQKNLNDLVQYGVNISIDDFGAGFTSISNFHKNTISSVKIDQSFIQNIHVNKNNQAILKGIISIAKSSNIVVIVEGVEKKLEKDKVLELGADCLQGYYISKPLDFPSIKKWLGKYSNQK
jgi:EAL domain-containing protein (putative c-di-GMP-specific phosphodiesterase class I)